jgi:3,4-dihydroxy 2-butanone 4-phosphate synthase/GTP cyclohydrolase II
MGHLLDIIEPETESGPADVPAGIAAPADEQPS